MAHPSDVPEVNIAYFLIVHKSPEQVVRLVRRLDAPGVTFYVHVDSTSPDEVDLGVRSGTYSMPNVHFVRSHPCYWAGIGPVLGTLDCIRTALSESPPVDYAVLLSGQDYPIRQHDEIISALGALEGSAHMNWMRLPDARWSRGGLERYKTWHVRLRDRTITLPYNPHTSTRIGRKWSSLLRRLKAQRPFLSGLAPFGGLAYWGMSRDVMAYVAGWADSNPAFVEYFRYVFAPDEMFFQTVLMNSPLRGSVVNHPLHYTKWDAAKSYAHPVTLTASDLPSVLSSGALFARKFDPAIDCEVLDLLDREIDGPASPQGA